MVSAQFVSLQVIEWDVRLGLHLSAAGKVAPGDWARTQAGFEQRHPLTGIWTDEVVHSIAPTPDPGVL